MPPPISRTGQITRTKDVREAARKFINALNELLEINRARNNGFYAINPGNDPAYETDDKSAQALGFGDASTMQSRIYDALSAAQAVQDNGYADTISAAAASESE